MVVLTKTLVDGYNRAVTVKDIVDSYRKIKSRANPNAGSIRKIVSDQSADRYNISLNSTATSFETFEEIKTKQEFIFDKNNQKIYLASQHHLAQNRCIVSDDGVFAARVHKSSNDHQNIEIWKNANLVRLLQTSEIDEHGPINLDTTFGNMSWNNGRLLYTCQRKKPKHIDYFKPDKKQSTPSSDSQTRGDGYLRDDNWNECLTNVGHTIIGIYDTYSDNIQTIEVENISLATPQWFNEGTQIVCSGYEECPRMIGIVYCNNRPCSLYLIDCESKQVVKKICEPGICHHSPRVNNKADKFLYLRNNAFGTHYRAVDIILYDSKSDKSELILENAYVELPYHCFSLNDQHIVFLEFVVTKRKLASIDLQSKTKKHLSSDDTTILDYRNNLLLVVSSRLNVTPIAKLIVFDDINHEIKTTLDLMEARSLEYQINEYDFPQSSGSINAILISPNESNDLPTVCNVHGGPHSLYLNTYREDIELSASLGLKYLLINYRGSIGYNQESAELLSGQAGILDVNDCIWTIKKFVELGLINPDKLVLAGGSHGGFLSCHLSCQDEIKFRCASILNPVTDLVGTFMTSDIPDWALNVGLGHKDYNPEYVPTSQEIQRLFEQSPNSKVGLACTPTIMLLGKNDLRVKMFQGERWVDNLKSRNIEVECRIYDDKHQLSKPEILADRTISTLVFIFEHLQN